MLHLAGRRNMLLLLVLCASASALRVPSENLANALGRRSAISLGVAAATTASPWANAADSTAVAG